MLVIDAIALVLIGFSLPACVLLLWLQWSTYRELDHPPVARVAGSVLLLGLGLLQGLHAAALLHAVPVLDLRVHAALLFLVAPAFFLFFRGALRLPGGDAPWQALHLAPLLLGLILPRSVAIPLAFVFGTGYALWLARVAWRLRASHRHPRLERAMLLLFAAMAVVALVLAAAVPLGAGRLFLLGYGSAIGLGLWLALALLLRVPDLADRARDTVRGAYAVTTLAKIDRAAALARLQVLMETERRYTDPALDLAGLATAVGLAPHQLSELINTELGVTMSRYLRGVRVAAAQRMLREEPAASVLSVGMAVGFSSQSNFYTAFRDIAGEVPGRYRERVLGGEAG